MATIFKSCPLVSLGLLFLLSKGAHANPAIDALKDKDVANAIYCGEVEFASGIDANQPICVSAGTHDSEICSVDKLDSATHATLEKKITALSLASQKKLFYDYLMKSSDVTKGNKSSLQVQDFANFLKFEYRPFSQQEETILKTKCEEFHRPLFRPTSWESPIDDSEKPGDAGIAI